MKQESKPILKLKENITYNIVSTIPTSGWSAKFSNSETNIKLIGWATVGKVGNDRKSNGFNGSVIVGLICIDGNNIVPCDLIESFTGYVEGA